MIVNVLLGLDRGSEETPKDEEKSKDENKSA
jgi:hypothetical protein